MTPAWSLGTDPVPDWCNWSPEGWHGTDPGRSLGEGECGTLG